MPGQNEEKQIQNFDLGKLEYYQRREARRTFVARVLLLSVIFGMLAANMALSQRNYETMIINMDQTRLAQVELQESTADGVLALQQEVTRLQEQVARLEAQQQQNHDEALASR